MLRILIDGYNFILQSPAYGPMARRDLEAGRDALIKDLSRYRKMKGYALTVVFDGGLLLPPWGGGGKQWGVEVVFSPPSKTADEIIKRLVGQKGGTVLVVTSDRELALSCERQGATVISAGEFENRLKKALSAETEVEIRDDTDQPSRGTVKKGPSRRLSKKERHRRARLDSL